MTNYNGHNHDDDGAGDIALSIAVPDNVYLDSTFQVTNYGPAGMLLRLLNDAVRTAMTYMYSNIEESEAHCECATCSQRTLTRWQRAMVAATTNLVTGSSIMPVLVPNIPPEAPEYEDAALQFMVWNLTDDSAPDLPVDLVVRMTEAAERYVEHAQAGDSESGVPQPTGHKNTVVGVGATTNVFSFIGYVGLIGARWFDQDPQRVSMTPDDVKEALAEVYRGGDGILGKHILVIMSTDALGIAIMRLNERNQESSMMMEKIDSKHDSNGVLERFSSLVDDMAGAETESVIDALVEHILTEGGE